MDRARNAVKAREKGYQKLEYFWVYFAKLKTNKIETCACYFQLINAIDLHVPSTRPNHLLSFQCRSLLSNAAKPTASHPVTLQGSQ